MGMAQLFSAQVIVSSGLTFSLPQLQDALAAEASQGSSDPFPSPISDLLDNVPGGRFSDFSNATRGER